MKTELYTDEVLFAQTARLLEQSGHVLKGIGTQGEKSVHSFIKYLLEPDASFHEQPVGRFVADIRAPGQIVEIQTGNCFPLVKKLGAFLQESPVTVVKPVYTSQKIFWMDPKTGAVDLKTGHGKSVKPASVLRDVWQMREYVSDPGFSLLLLEMETEEYRLKNGYGASGKIRAQKLDKYPVRITAGTLFETPSDYAAFFPEDLDEPFTVDELGKIMKLGSWEAHAAVNVFRMAGMIRSAGKRGRALVYSKATQED